MKLPARFLRPPLWLLLFLIWFGTLWVLSSTSAPAKTDWGISHMDKVYHFGYFFGGSGILSAFLYRLQHHNPDWTRILILVMSIMIFTGSLDEWHQSWVPERSGNDAQDLTADLLGSLAGFLVFRRLHFLMHSE
jgi:VanZ family protein